LLENGVKLVGAGSGKREGFYVRSADMPHHSPFPGMGLDVKVYLSLRVTKRRWQGEAKYEPCGGSGVNLQLTLVWRQTVPHILHLVECPEKRQTGDQIFRDRLEVRCVYRSSQNIKDPKVWVALL
jgi:hypothetical protein